MTESGIRAAPLNVSVFEKQCDGKPPARCSPISSHQFATVPSQSLIRIVCFEAFPGNFASCMMASYSSLVPKYVPVMMRPASVIFAVLANFQVSSLLETKLCHSLKIDDMSDHEPVVKEKEY